LHEIETPTSEPTPFPKEEAHQSSSENLEEHDPNRQFGNSISHEDDKGKTRRRKIFDYANGIEHVKYQCIVYRPVVKKNQGELAGDW
jgi:hypothetical protein